MTTALSSTRRDVDEVRPFHAPASLFENLQRVLVDLIELHLQGKQAHWNLLGTNFRDLHLQLDGTSIRRVRRATRSPNVCAPWMRFPMGRRDTVVATISAPAIPPGLVGTTETVDMISNRIYAVVGTTRAVHDDVDAADPSTADLLHAIIDGLEKEAWLLKSENGAA